jgi:hypothetical protein
VGHAARTPAARSSESCGSESGQSPPPPPRRPDPSLLGDQARLAVAHWQPPRPWGHWRRRVRGRLRVTALAAGPGRRSGGMPWRVPLSGSLRVRAASYPYRLGRTRRRERWTAGPWADTSLTRTRTPTRTRTRTRTRTWIRFDFKCRVTLSMNQGRWSRSPGPGRVRRRADSGGRKPGGSAAPRRHCQLQAHPHVGRLSESTSESQRERLVRVNI